jgi:hypothetical protein
LEDCKKKQIKFEPEYSKSPIAKQQPRELSHGSLRSKQENNRQTTLEEFFYLAGDEDYYDDTQ